jgi:hypothetical protein
MRRPLIELEGFDRPRLSEVAARVRGAHGIAYGWPAAERLGDELLTRLIEDSAARFGEKLKTVPRGFLKVLVDILDELEQNPQADPAEVLASGSYADRIEEVEREEAHLQDSP